MIKEKIKNKIKQIIGKATYNKPVLSCNNIPEHSSLSYSLEGEDIILLRFLEAKPSGFYIDVGAYHPKRFSNTYMFYLKGWDGINIDAMPGSMNNFMKLRPRDINLEIPISNKKQTLTYYSFNEPAINTFSEKVMKKYTTVNHFPVIKEIKIETERLDSILDKYLKENRKIDFLNIDVEGMDIEVLESNNWNKYRPVIVLAEEADFLQYPSLQSPISKYMTKINYSFLAKTRNTIFFKDNNQDVI